MMNLLFISHTGGLGGAETVLIDVIKTVSCDKSNKIFIAIPNDGDDNFIKNLGAVVNDCVIERFAFRPIRNTTMLLVRNLSYGLLLGLPKLVRFIKDNQIDVVYVNSSVNVIGIMAARIAGRKYIWHIHEQSNVEHRWSPKWFNKFYRKWLSDKKCRSIFVSNQSYKMWLDDIEVDTIPNSKVIYSLYKQILIDDRSDRWVTFGYIGSLSENKNVGRLIEAFEALPKGFKLLIGGAGESEEKFKTLAQNNSDIEFLGYINNLEQFYSKIDCLVVPSLNESWGLVVLEAMSAGVPVIMTKNSGVVEIFNNDEDCMFVEPTSVEDITAAMMKVAENPDFAKRITQNAKNKLQVLNINHKFPAQLMAIIYESKN